MTQNTGALLIAEIGSVTTKVTLTDTVDGEMRLLFRAEQPSTLDSPYRDAMVAVMLAVRHISEATGRRLFTDHGDLLMPQTAERDGVNGILVLTSAAGTLSLIILAVAKDISARSALHASRSTYTNIVQVVTLDDALVDSGSETSTSWIERQVESLLVLKPDVALIAGGLEGGPRESLQRLAQMVGFVALHASQSTFADRLLQADGDSESRPHSMAAIYAGNSSARPLVQEALAGRRLDVVMADNVRPTLVQERLDDTRQTLQRLYSQRILPQLPGMANLVQVADASPTTVCQAQGLMTRFLAEHYQRQVLTLDIGSTSCSAFFAAPGRYHMVILGLSGSGYGISPLLSDESLERMMYWLPFTISRADLKQWLLNKLLRPQLIPVTMNDLLIEHAIARELITQLMHHLRDECPTLAYDLVIVGGGILANAPPALAAITLLDALQPSEARGVADAAPLAIDLHLDSLGLLAVCGALAGAMPEAAVTMVDRDLLQHTPLATCVVALGSGKAGKVAVETELTQSNSGKGFVNRGTQKLSVKHGEIRRIPLTQGARAQLTLRPGSSVRIGHNPPGAEVRSDVAAIGGSILGVIIDARGRPVRPANRDQIRQWLVMLEAVAPGDIPKQVSLSDSRATTESSTTASPKTISAAATPAPMPIPVPPAPTPAAATVPAVAAEPAPPASKRISLGDLQTTPPAVGTEESVASGKAAAGGRISLSDLQATPATPAPAAPPADDLTSDLSKLRQTVEAKPEKRGLFGRRKK